ncbi:MAG: GTP cyclohydrolase II [Sphingomonadaceae bacterium]|nr:GTP cyclohydrolase II [Sphingomonadaceae bacterium]
MGQALGPCSHRDGIRILSEVRVVPGDARQAARAIDALRRGWPVRVNEGEGELTLVALETATSLGDASRLLLSGNRAVTLKLANQRDAADPASPVLVNLPMGADLSLAIAIADPVLDLRYPMKGPFVAEPIVDGSTATAALELCRLAGLLPACLVVDAGVEAALSVMPGDVAAFDDSGALDIAARARLPIAASSEAEIIAFRSAADAADHVALIIGKRDSSPPVVRLHSECLTGDVLGSLKCDCGPQLHEALRQISDARWGILLYLRQEGRGIGLINKLRAYALQDQGFDTVDANMRLGFAINARDFSVAARMLELLGVAQIRLLTNNPEKVAGLEAQGISVVERLPLKIVANPHNAHYLQTKKDRTGHRL